MVLKCMKKESGREGDRSCSFLNIEMLSGGATTIKRVLLDLAAACRIQLRRENV